MTQPPDPAPSEDVPFLRNVLRVSLAAAAVIVAAMAFGIAAAAGPWLALFAALFAALTWAAGALAGSASGRLHALTGKPFGHG